MMPTGLPLKEWLFGRNPFICIQRASDGQWAFDGRVKRFHVGIKKRCGVSLLSIVVGPWAVRVGWALDSHH